jgi:DEAD/DEAH box helicase domain-containing protein
MEFTAFDLEIIHSPTAPGHSWGRPEALGLSVACTWTEADGFLDWFAEDAGRLLDYLAHGAHGPIVTWNGAAFDYSVMDGACRRPRGSTLRTLAGHSIDLMLIAQDALGHRVKLESAAMGTLGRGKTGNGATAPILWAQGRRLEVIQYCRNDVQLTADLFRAGCSGRDFKSIQENKPDVTWKSPPTIVPNLPIGRNLLSRV